eukprot:scaffold80941_cov57-Phaeocystis_antarctica.AAC.3
MYIAAKARSPDSSSRYLIDWGNSSRKVIPVRSRGSHGGSFLAIWREIERRGHVEGYSTAVSSFATTQQPGCQRPPHCTLARSTRPVCTTPACTTPAACPTRARHVRLHRRIASRHSAPPSAESTPAVA